MRPTEESDYDNLARIKVIGVGGGGGKALDEMICRPLHKSIEYIAVNTDIQALERSLASQTIQIGTKLLRGSGARSDPELGRQAAIEDYERIKDALDEADMVIIVACMGGGMGTGAAPVIAHIAQELGALTVPIVTRPFFFEGKKRSHNAEQGITELLALQLSLIVIPCDATLLPRRKGIAYSDFEMLIRVDRALCTAVQGITDPILLKGLICYDFADHRAILTTPGIGVVGIGKASGPSRARDAAMQAISSPLFAGICINFAQGVLAHFRCGQDYAIDEIAEASSVIQEAAHEEAWFYMTVCVDELLNDEMHIIVTATGLT